MHVHTVTVMIMIITSYVYILYLCIHTYTLDLIQLINMIMIYIAHTYQKFIGSYVARDVK